MERRFEIARIEGRLNSFLLAVSDKLRTGS